MARAIWHLSVRQLPLFPPYLSSCAEQIETVAWSRHASRLRNAALCFRAHAHV